MGVLPVLLSENVPGFGEIPRLSAGRCRELLAGTVGGHLAVSLGALPLVVPVTCALEGDYLLVRAGRGWVVRASFQPGVVAFQTASTSFDQASRWEVVVQGRAEVLSSSPAADVPPPLPLIANEGTTVLRICMEIVTGWQYGAPPMTQRSRPDVLTSAAS
ncbi:MAG TPA: pyridoxamine 5'-phosphate oxidase family protein [Acidimicrobiales bacterium]|nr:pyridoxamine 5'-phosphate oxidase family protein [Acidimicrobiales bacterium]